MPLTPDQEKQLAELQAEQARPEPRTETGLAGILHTVLDVVSGAVPHLAAETWAQLHSQVEGNFGEQQPAEQPAPDEGQAADDSGTSSPSSPGKASSSAKKG
jgi:leucyl-tRNA synthetase